MEAKKAAGRGIERHESVISLQEQLIHPHEEVKQRKG